MATSDDTLSVAPTKEVLDEFKPNSSSGKIPSKTERANILKELEKVGVNSAGAVQALISLGLEAFDKGATDSTTFSDSYNSDVSHKAVAAAIKKADVTIHKVCFYYAKPIFAIKQQANQPPAMWASKDIPEPYKWCAFDFFEGLYTPGTVESAIPFTPPNEETRMAYTMYKTIQITKANARKGNVLSFNPNVTAGRITGIQELPALPPPQ